MLEKGLQDEFISIIREELVPAMGCTEPIALAYAAARGRKRLAVSRNGSLPDAPEI